MKSIVSKTVIVAIRTVAAVVDMVIDVLSVIRIMVLTGIIVSVAAMTTTIQNLWRK